MQDNYNQTTPDSYNQTTATFTGAQNSRPLRLVAVKRPEAIVCDLDGTTFGTDGKVAKRTAQALRSARQEGIEVLFATGRPDRVIGALEEANIGHDTVICSNGANVIDANTKKSLSLISLEPALVSDVITRVRGALPEATFAVETTDGFVFEHSGEVQKATEELLTMGDESVERIDPFELPPIMKTFIIDQTKSHEEFSRIGFDAIGTAVYSTFSGVPGTIEFGPKGVNKATALERFSQQRGIDSADFWAFGDMPNDLEMLQWAGTGWAMGNAHPSVKAIADRHCATNEQHGLAQAIEAMLEGRDIYRPAAEHLVGGGS